MFSLASLRKVGHSRIYGSFSWYLRKFLVNRKIRESRTTEPGSMDRYPSMTKLRNKMYMVVANLIQERTGKRRGRFVLPNCVTAGIRGMAYGNGEFTGFKQRENANPNSP